MLVLGLDTSAETASVGVVDASGRAHEETKTCHRALSRELVGMIDRVLAGAGVKPADLDAVAVAAGPGSFTGLRVGLAAAQGLAFALDKPLVPVPTLEALASLVPIADLPLAMLQRARKNELYLAVFSPKDGRWTMTVAETAVAPDALAGLITVPTLLAGNAVELFREQIVAQLKDRAVFGPAIVPSGCAVARWALARAGTPLWARRDTLDPLYVKDPDAKPAVKKTK